MSTTAPGPSGDKPAGGVRYNFWTGHPNRANLPTAELREILRTVSSDDDDGDRLGASLQYLASDRGDPALLGEISRFLKRQTASDDRRLPSWISPEQRQSPSGDDDDEHLDLFLTHGVSHGLDVVCTAQTTPGDTVLIERPSYFLAAGIFRSHGLVVESLPMKGGGNDGGRPLAVDVDALEEGLEDGTIPVPRMVYVVPTHNNPTAGTMPLEDRWKLCRLARRHGFLVAADEVYYLLDWRENKAERPARFSVLDRILAECDRVAAVAAAPTGKPPRPGCSVSVSSLTKIFAPGVRCGWIEGPTEIVDSIVGLGYIRSQGSCAPFVGNLMRTALEGGYQDRILEGLNESYKIRAEMLCDALASEPGICVRCRPTGGYFVWVDFAELPEKTTTAAATTTSSSNNGGNDRRNDPASLFARYCRDRGLRIMPGVKCDSVADDNKFERSRQPRALCQNSVRLCFAYMEERDIAEGAELLVQLYREYTRKNNP